MKRIITMKDKLLCLFILVVTGAGMLYSQGVEHPWWVVDRGGGKSTSGSVTLHASIGQPAIQKMTYIDTGSVLESGFIPGVRFYSGSYTSVIYHITDSWNMISVPLIVDDYRKTTLFSNAVSSAFCYTGTYESRDTLLNGTGYWLKYSAAETSSVSGTSYTIDTIDVIDRWNMMGSLSYPVLTSDAEAVAPMTFSTGFYGYDGAYVEVDTLLPGKAYWIKTSEAGKIVMKTGSLLFAKNIPTAAMTPDAKADRKISTIAEKTGMNVLAVEDAEGRTSNLYFTSKKLAFDIGRFELPPLPPDGVHDVRFASQRSVESFDYTKNDLTQKFRILLNGVMDPVTLRWEIQNDENSYALEVISEDGKTTAVPLKSANIMTLNTDNLKTLKLIMERGSCAELPAMFALHQNYPNPFNPATMIKYDLPADAKVNLIVYNLLGQVVEKLVDEAQSAGFRHYEWNAGNYPSGVYYYRLSAHGDNISFSDVKKLMIIK